MQIDTRRSHDEVPLWAGPVAMAALGRCDWSASELGRPAGWPIALGTAASIVLNGSQPMFIAWGPALSLLANEALRSLLGEAVDAAQGGSFALHWPELHAAVEPQMRAVLSGEAVRLADLPLRKSRGASGIDDGHDLFTEPSADRSDAGAIGFFGVAMSPVHDERGQVAGVFAVLQETTDRLQVEAELFRAKARATHVLEGVDEAFMLLDADFRIEQANAVTLRMDGRPASEIIGRSHWDVWPQSVGTELEHTYRRAMQRRESVVIEQRVVGANAVVGAAGDTGAQPLLHLEIRAFPFGDGLAVFARDVSARKRAQRREATLLEFVDRVRDLDDPIAIASTAAEIAGRVFRVSRAGYARLDATEEWALIEKDWTAPGVRSIVGTHHMLSFGKDFLGALRAGESVVLADAATDPRTAGSSAGFAHIGVTALLNIPLIEHGRLAAILFLHEQRPRQWSQADISLWREIGQRAWAAADRARAKIEARLAAERLHTSETRFRRLADLGPSIVWLGHTDGSISYLNERWFEFTGQTIEQALPTGWADAVHPDDLERLHDTWARSREHGLPYLAEARLRRVDGEYRWYLITAAQLVDDTGTVSWLGSNADIHDRKMREDAVRDQRDRIWNLSTDLMIVARVDGTIEAVNPAWHRLLGWTEQELVGEKLIDFVHPDDVLPTLAELSTLANGKTTLRFENRYRRRDGEWLPLSWTAVPGVGSLHAVGRDMSAEKAAAATLQRTEDALRQAQKMEAVGQLTGGIAHDFNNLLQGITGSLDLVKKRLTQGRAGEIDKFVASAMSSASRAAALTHRLLAFSRRQPLDPKPVKTNQLVASMDDLLRRTMGERIEIEMVLAAGLWVTLCDPNQLESALLNLAINARDAMPDGGKLLLTTGNHEVGAQDSKFNGILDAGRYIRIIVSDNGCGMPQAVLDKVFEPFFSTKGPGLGTGLGLSMVYGFVKQSGGHIEALSAPGHGTTFLIYLPKASAPAELAAVPVVPDAETTSARGNETILCVEDDDNVRSYVLTRLQSLGYRTIAAANAAEALALVDRGELFDLLFTDIVMPGKMNGRQLAEAVAQRRPALKVLFTSGYTENDDIINHAQMNGEILMLAKPYRRADLNRMIRLALESPPPAIIQNARADEVS
ncbi:MAG: hybrid sensor histidine kinase/response regulator [Rhizobacter sp.]|nr:hybrid sensor histidine kinase/response regulator [Rhizobacter sp.]